MRTAVSQDGKWIAGGTRLGRVTAWDAESVCVHRRPERVGVHNGRIAGRDGNRNHETACVWSHSTSKRSRRRPNL